MRIWSLVGLGGFFGALSTVLASLAGARVGDKQTLVALKEPAAPRGR
jgi:hypothetical protein